MELLASWERSNYRTYVTTPPITQENQLCTPLPRFIDFIGIPAIFTLRPKTLMGSSEMISLHRGLDDTRGGQNCEVQVQAHENELFSEGDGGGDGGAKQRRNRDADGYRQSLPLAFDLYHNTEK